MKGQPQQTLELIIDKKQKNVNLGEEGIFRVRQNRRTLKMMLLPDSGAKATVGVSGDIHSLTLSKTTPSRVSPTPTNCPHDKNSLNSQ